MDTESRVTELVARWHEARSRGEQVSLAELCHDFPELASEVGRRLDAIDRVARLAGPGAPAFQAAGPAEEAEQKVMVDPLPVAPGEPPGGGEGNGPTCAEGPSIQTPDDVFDALPCWLGGLHLLRRLGAGGMGVVYHAHDPRLDRFRAVKVMKPALAEDQARRQMFLDEARAAARIKHRNIVPLYHAGEDRGLPFFVMELLEGESLQDRLDREPRPSLAVVLQVGQEVALGLAAAHAEGRVHRDVKPLNVWLEGNKGDAPRRVVVLDFGLAQPVSAGGDARGTPGYMSPEQWQADRVDYRSDLFSLGCLLYRMATGEPAFVGKDHAELREAALTRTPPPARARNPAVPEGLSRLIGRLLEKDPRRRPATARAVADELEALARVPRRRLWIGGAAAVLLLAAGVVAWMVAGGGKRPPLQPLAYSGSVDLLVHRVDGDGSDIAVPLSDPRALPLHPGDHFKITAEVDPPAYLYLIWVDEKGAAVPVYPWALGNWGTRPAKEKPLPRLEVKAPNGNWLKVTGETSAMETVLMLARPTPLQASDVEVQAWFAGLASLPLRGVKARVWFQDFDLLRHDATRSPSYDDDLEQPTSPLGLQGVLRERIGREAAFSRAISFARLGKKEGD
jgi:tRNA A-37 threonylcarbamoyl transferase component Bud32